MLKNSDFEAQGAWKVAQRNLTYPYTVDFGVTTSGFKGSSGKCLEITYDASTGGSGEIEVFVYQRVKITKGNTYKFSAAMQDLSASITDAWIEIFWYPDTIGNAMSVNEISVAKFGTFQACTGIGYEGLIDTSCAVYNKSSKPYPYFNIPDTLKQDSISIGIDVGTWGNTANFDLLFDNLTMVDSAAASGILHVNNYNKIFDFYPNLSDGLVKLISKTATPASYKVISLLGAVIKEGRFNGSKVIDLTSLQKGIYFVNLEGEGKSYTSKLILK